MAVLRPSERIEGVIHADLRPVTDERGSFAETFRTEWFPARAWTVVQSNRSTSLPGVLRGLHYHHHQADYWLPLAGRMRAALADLRPASPTFRQTEIVDLDGSAPAGLLIPPGVAHGYLALTDATLLYLVDAYYTGTDEHGVAWDDPELRVAWGTVRPQLSRRDLSNPRLADIPPESLPPFEQETVLTDVAAPRH